MPGTPRKPKRDPFDINELAFDILRDVTGEEPPAEEPDAEKVEGGRKGGKARAAGLTAERRTDIAKKAAGKRWKSGS